jgi:CHASE3 domain sensor protein
MVRRKNKTRRNTKGKRTTRRIHGGSVKLLSSVSQEEERQKYLDDVQRRRKLSNENIDTILKFMETDPMYKQAKNYMKNSMIVDLEKQLISLHNS